MAEDQNPTSRPLTRRELRERERAASQRRAEAQRDSSTETLFMRLSDVEEAEAGSTGAQQAPTARPQTPRQQPGPRQTQTPRQPQTPRQQQNPRQSQGQRQQQGRTQASHQPQTSRQPQVRPQSQQYSQSQPYSRPQSQTRSSESSWQTTSAQPYSQHRPQPQQRSWQERNNDQPASRHHDLPASRDNDQLESRQENSTPPWRQSEPQSQGRSQQYSRRQSQPQSRQSAGDSAREPLRDRYESHTGSTPAQSYRAESYPADSYRAEPRRTEQRRTEQRRTEQHRTEQRRTEPRRSEPRRAEPYRADAYRAEPYRGEAAYKVEPEASTGEQPRYPSRRDARRPQRDENNQGIGGEAQAPGGQPQDSRGQRTRRALSTPVSSGLRGQFDDEVALEEYESERVEKLRAALEDARIEASPSFNDVLGIAPEEQWDAQRKLETTGVISPVTRNVRFVVPQPSLADEEEEFYGAGSDAFRQQPEPISAPGMGRVEDNQHHVDGEPVSAIAAHGLDPLTYQEGGGRPRILAMGVVGGSAVIAVSAALFTLLSK